MISIPSSKINGWSFFSVCSGSVLNVYTFYYYIVFSNFNFILRQARILFGVENPILQQG